MRMMIVIKKTIRAIRLSAPTSAMALVSPKKEISQILSDPEKQNAERYDVLALGGLYAKRWTYYIDAKGVIRRIDKNVDPKSAGQDVVKTLRELEIGTP